MQTEQTTTRSKSKNTVVRNAKNAGRSKFLFSWGDCWNHCIEYKVRNFRVEVDFFKNILGFSCHTKSDDYVMFTGPQKEFFFAFRPTLDGEISTPPDAIAMDFMIENLGETLAELKDRGITEVIDPVPNEAGSNLYRAFFYSPAGIRIGLWSVIDN